MRADQPECGILDDHVGLAKLCAPGPNRLDFPAFENEAGLKSLFDEVIVKSFAVLDDGHGWYRGRGGIVAADPAQAGVV